MDLGNSSVKAVTILGCGGFGRVFLCKYHNKYDVCVKRIIVKNPTIDMKMILQEIYIISQMHHPCIVRFIDSFVHAGSVNIIMEYAPNGTLHNLIERSQPNGLDAPNVLRFFCNILMGLEYLHIRHVIHRDLKPANLLLDAAMCVKIADFGISLVHNPHNRSDAFGTPYYQAPEMMHGEKIDYKSDIWSLGCILHEMCIGRHPFAQATNLQTLQKLVGNLRRYRLDCSQINYKLGPMWAQLCERMIVYHVKHRISLTEIVTFDANLTIPYYYKYFAYKY